VARRPLEREGVYLDGGRRTTQLMRDSLGSSRSPHMNYHRIALILFIASACAPSRQAQRPSAPVADSLKGSVPSMDSVMAVLVAYSQKRISANGAAKVIVDRIMATGQPLNLEMDAELREAVTREMKQRQQQ